MKDIHWTANRVIAEMEFETAKSVGRTPHGSSDDPSVLDFSANTNPLVPAAVEEAFSDSFESARSYPAEPPERYRAAAANYVDCKPEQVIPTSGGLAAIRLAISLVVSPGDSVLVPAPSFGEYEREVRLQGGTPEIVSHDEVLATDPTDHALAIVCNPNNPTGEAADSNALQTFATRCRDAGTVLLVDEAFLGFTDQPSLAGTDGVIVARSLTKLFGLPGIRTGFAVATGDLRNALCGARRAWNLSVPALETGIVAMGEREFIAETRNRVESERERLRTALAEQFDVYSSDSPFLLFDVGDHSVSDICQHARVQGVVLRDARTFRGLDNHIRVAIRLPDENDRLLEVLADV